MTASRPDLTRRAAALAAFRGWEVLRTLRSDEHELRQLVMLRGAASPAVLRVRSPGPEAMERAQAEIDALSGTPSEHVLSLIEVVPEHPRRREIKRGAPPATVLLEHAPGGLLADLLERRPYLRAGETATILIAVAAGLVALSERGWAHGALTSRSVVFRDDGCPAVATLGSAQPLSSQSAQADRRGFLRLAERLCTSMPRGDGDRMLEALREPLCSGDWQEVVDALAVVVEPEAVFVPADDPAAAESTGRRLDGAPGPGPGPGHVRRGERGTPAAGVLGTLLEGHPVAELVQRAREWLRGRARLVWIVLSPLAIAVAVLAVLPAETSAKKSPAAAPAGSPAAPSTGPTREPARVDDTQSADPVVAAAALLRSRHSCFVTKGVSASCLDDSTQPDSALYRDDSGALGTSGAAAQRDFEGAAFELAQQWGNAALVMATTAEGVHSEPASILLVRSEAGWRLRDVYVD